MTGHVLALNCGSSSVRFAVFGDDLVSLFRGQVENIAERLEPRLLLDGRPGEPLPHGLAGHGQIIEHLLDRVILPRTGGLAVAGHRVVHGGTRFSGPTLIDDMVAGDIEALSALAPSHQPHNLAGIRALAKALPRLPQVACFDTAFHRTIPEVRQLMALPERFAAEGLRRFGFHGLSYQSIVARLPDVTGGEVPPKTVICHLGNGCSLAGLIDGASVFTSMGFTPLDGLVMGRRPGRLDPGAVLWLIERHEGDAGAVDRLFNRESGLLGVSGLSPDMRTLLASGNGKAARAVAMFVDRLILEIGSAVAATGGLDALVFTGGIGENAAPVRAAVVEALGWLGLDLDEAANGRHAPTITRGHPSAHVIATDEERVIAASALECLGREALPSSLRQEEGQDQPG